MPEAYDRRSTLKAAAWSVPVITAAIASPAASASVVGKDLSVIFMGTRTRYFAEFGQFGASIEHAAVLSVRNIGNEATFGEVLSVIFSPGLGSDLRLHTIDDASIVRSGLSNFIVTLPSLRPGEFITLSMHVLSLPPESVSGDAAITASLSTYDADLSNNTASNTAVVMVNEA